MIDKHGAPDRIRTHDPQIRSLVLYPAELRALTGGVSNPSGREKQVSSVPWGLAPVSKNPGISPGVLLVQPWAEGRT